MNSVTVEHIFETMEARVNPEGVQGVTAGYGYVITGQGGGEWTVKITDGRVEVLQGPEGLELINRPKTASYTLLWTPRHPMTTAIVLRVTDEPTLARPKSDTGTLLVQVVPRRKRFAPGLCGGPSQ